MRIIINGEELEGKIINTASTRAVQALQRATGLKMSELIAKANDTDALDSELWNLKACEFLTEHSRGRCVSWDKVWDRPIPQVLPDEIDERRAAEAGETDEGPTRARTGSPADAAPAAHAPKGKTRKSSGSSKKNRGSKTRSDPAS
ncbi:hypothetical protein ACFWGN_16145 [Oerskovia sp. NPDC060338]|uniref:hypothetical protein n=1 Tax=Oerskovia sp. NPDC060338 TaxID=3347100 RepID=UPI00364DBD60